jgi:hypothetical protein
MVDLRCMARLAQFHLVLTAKVCDSVSNDQQRDSSTSYNGIWVLSKQDSVSGLQLRMESNTN